MEGSRITLHIYMGKTRSGIYYNLKESEYKCTINGVTYFFSSNLYLCKFIERYIYERDILNYSLSKRFKINLNMSKLSDLKTYSSIEKRGFYVMIGECDFTCLEAINLELQLKTLND